MNKRIPYYTVNQPLWSVPLNKRIEILIPGLSFQSARDANNVYPSITSFKGNVGLSKNPKL